MILVSGWQAVCVQAGDASGTGFFDTNNRCYDKTRMESIDSSLHTYLPELIGPDDVPPPRPRPPPSSFQLNTCYANLPCALV